MDASNAEGEATEQGIALHTQHWQNNCAISAVKDSTQSKNASQDKVRDGTASPGKTQWREARPGKANGKSRTRKNSGLYKEHSRATSSHTARQRAGGRDIRTEAQPETRRQDEGQGIAHGISLLEEGTTGEAVTESGPQT